VANLRRS